MVFSRTLGFPPPSQGSQCHLSALPWTIIIFVPPYWTLWLNNPFLVRVLQPYPHSGFPKIQNVTRSVLKIKNRLTKHILLGPGSSLVLYSRHTNHKKQKVFRRIWYEWLCILFVRLTLERHGERNFEVLGCQQLLSPLPGLFCMKPVLQTMTLPSLTANSIVGCSGEPDCLAGRECSLESNSKT